MNLIKNNKMILYTFVMAFVIMTLAFANEKIFPFGPNQIMIIDSWHQYYPFLQELHQKLTEGGSIFYSWNTGGGTNFYLLMAYYVMSPLNLLSLLFPKEYLREFMLLATILKIAFAAACFALYIRGIHQKNDLSLMIFGLSYGFCGFLMGFYWDIMWLDCVALLPLILLGMHRLIHQGKYHLYVISLGFALISNFYIGYFICEFIFIYFFIQYFIQFSKEGRMHFLNKLKSMASFSLLGVGLAAIVLVPTFFGMQRAYGLSSADPTQFATYFPLLDFFNNLLATMKPTVVKGLPNVYSGLFAVILVIVYFSMKAIPLKSKVLNGGLLSMLILSFNINYLNFIWHGFHFPNEVPYRFSFLFSFVVIALAYEAYLQLHTVSPKTLLKIVGFLVMYLIVIEKLYSGTLDAQLIYINMGFIVVYGIIMILKQSEKISKPIFTAMICYVIIGEIILAANGATLEAGHSGRDDYPTLNDSIQSSLSEIKKTDNGFYRVELYNKYSANDPVLYGYRGMSQFSSTSNSLLNKFAKRLGVSADPGGNSMTFLPATPVVNGLFSIKYIMTKFKPIPMPNIAYTLINENLEIKAYHNKFYLPLGFMVSNRIGSWNLEGNSPFWKQEQFLNLATDEQHSIYETFGPVDETYDNMERTSLNNNRFSYKNIDSTKKGHCTIRFEAPKTGQIYVYMLNQTKTVNLKVDGLNKSYETPRGVTMDLGILKKETPIELTFEVNEGKTGYFDIQAVYFDEEAFSKAREMLIDESLEVIEYSDTRILGTIKVLEEGLLYTSIPYEKGWSVKVDGVKVPVVALQEAMLAVPMTPGEHSVELTYLPYGFKVGMGITIVAIILLLFIPKIRKISVKLKRLKPTGVDALQDAVIDKEDEARDCSLENQAGASEVSLNEKE